MEEVAPQLENGYTRLANEILERLLVEEDRGEPAARVHGLGPDPQELAEIALHVAVDGEYAAAESGHARSDVRGETGLADTAFVAADRDDVSHGMIWSYAAAP